MSETSLSGQYRFESIDEVAELASSITGDTFDAWYREHQHAQNIREGTPYFNGPPSQQPPERHSPSKLLQCHRRAYYKHFNAPQETEAPDGIFWIGDQFETEVAVPFLRSLVDDDLYVRNSMWIDIETTVDERDIRIRGETDPVIVDRESKPLLLTEIKTTSSIEYLDAPKRHHKAQVHAYLHGLSLEQDRNVTDAVIIYGARESFDVRTFHIEFDPRFWHEISDWAATQSGYREDEILPPADPEFGWECQYCAYQTRCGQGEGPFEDMSPSGLLPLTRYPQEPLTTYLNGHPSASLTPTTAYQYPDLVAEFGVSDWECDMCAAEYSFDAIDWDGNTSTPPQCPDCRCDGRPGRLSGPVPDTQTTENREPEETDS